MLTNLMRPWVLARLIAGVTAVGLSLYGAVVAARVLRFWRIGTTSEGQLALERRAELAATIVHAALGIGIANLALTLLMADRLTHSVSGAMCAWGVFDASPLGFWALAATVIAAAACAFWIILHRFDMALAEPVLTRRKFFVVLLIAPLLVADLGLTARWIYDLDFSVVASCCSVGIDEVGVVSSGARSGPRWSAAGIALSSGVIALFASLFIALRTGARRSVDHRSVDHRSVDHRGVDHRGVDHRSVDNLVGWLASSSSLAATIFALPAIVWVVAPHAYETPHHLCPFCLLDADVVGIGWFLFSALFCAAVLGIAVGFVTARRAASLQRQLARGAAIAWLVTIVAALAPIVRYAWVTGGASLFGTGS